MERLRNYMVVYFCAFIGPLPGNAIFSMTSELKSTFDATLDEIYLSIPAFIFPFAIFQLFSGTVSDRWDRRLTLVVGLLVYALASAGIAVTSSFLVFMLLRIGQGIGYAFVGPVTVAILGDITSVGKYGLAMGLYGSSVAAALTVGPIIGGLAAGQDWRTAFGIFSLLAFAALLWVVLFVRLAAIERSRNSMSRDLGSVLHNRNILLASSIGALTFFATIGIVSFLADELRMDRFGYSAYQVGLLVSFSGLPGVVISPLAGSITDRCSPRLAIMVGVSLMLPSSIAFSIAGEFWEFLLLLSIMGAGMAFATAGMLTISVEEMPGLRGTSSSVFNSSRFTGYAVSPLLLSPLFLRLGYDWIVIVCFAVLLVSMAAAVALSGKACRSSG